MNTEQYHAQLQALLPVGAAWPRDAGLVRTELMRAFAEELASIDLAFDRLIEEADPRTTFELLAEWERAAGLPDPCGGEDQSTSQRRVSLLQKLTSLGGASSAYFIAVAATLGMVITITEFTPHDVDDDVEAPLLGDAWAYTWQVNAPLNTVTELTVESGADDPLAWWNHEPLECVMEALKPAHTVVMFAYS